MATTNTTHVNFVKVPTMAKFDDLTSKVDGTIYFIVDAKKIYLDGVMYGFNDADVADRFLELDGGTINGILNASQIESVNHVAFSTDSAIVAGTPAEGGITFQIGGPTGINTLIKLKADGSILFDSDDIRGIPEPAAASSPISKGYFEGIMSGLIGVNNGIATLDDSGKVPSGQLPSYIDDVKDYNNRTSFPNTGESSKLYLALDTGDIWRWSGSTYVRISDGSGLLVLGNTSSTAFRGDYGAEAYDHIFLTQEEHNPHNITKDNVGLGNVENYGIATKGEAESGSGNAYMTPERTAQAIDAIAPRLTWQVVS